MNQYVVICGDNLLTAKVLGPIEASEIESVLKSVNGNTTVLPLKSWDKNESQL